ncbi:MAG: 50S ribosomal protein L25 [Ignavibacteriales bacterium UTCHB2]|jgi:large subunit ribosomal protein L25|nr:MAG: General stress protein CTC [Ignavibacteria bacterium ADurb.Bin266]OQY71594.1 MAG: 50S ribosomal protein L25 [Ignavibacteriales bacterium UTCHB2]HQI41452.1 50S ribosomal protein L25 [Ignavibacteriaceae bacterium]
MEKVLINAKKRTQIDKAARSLLRKEGKIPAIFYSKHHEPIPVEVEERLVNPLVFTAKTHLITLNVDKENEFECIIKDVQFDPVTDRIVHVDFLGLQKDEKIQLEIPVQLVGSAIGIKEGGVLQHILYKILIECLPSNIPAHIEIDITNLKLGQAIHVSDLSSEKYTILNSPESMIASVTHPRVEKEAAPVEEGTEPAEPEVIAKGKQDKEE